MIPPMKKIIDLRKITIRILDRPEDCLLWNELVKEQHYLKNATMVGQQIRYVAEYMGKWVACMGYSAGTLKSNHRSKWTGWSPIQEKQRLHLVIQNARFLILEGVSTPNLASRCLSLVSKRISSDWQKTYGHPVYLLETFVDQDRSGTCYKACGWENLGQTKGFRRETGGYSRHNLKKSYWVFPLRKNAREKLGSIGIIDDKPLSSINIKLLPLQEKEGQQSIQDILREYFPEKERAVKSGTAYSTSVTLGLVLTGLVCGIEDCEKIAFWAKHLDQKYKEILKCPYREREGVWGYQAPSANTIRYALQDIDVKILEDAMTAWASLCGINTQNTILALDGKVLCGAKTDDDRAPNHVTLYEPKSGIVLDQDLVSNKTTEVPVAREIFERNDLSGTLVTADAAHTNPKTAAIILKKKATFCSRSKTISLSFSTPWKKGFSLQRKVRLDLTLPMTAGMDEMKNGPLKRSLSKTRIK